MPPHLCPKNNLKGNGGLPDPPLQDGLCPYLINVINAAGPTGAPDPPPAPQRLSFSTGLAGGGLSPVHYPAPQGKGLPASRVYCYFFYSPIPKRAPNLAGFYPFTAALSAAGPSPAKKTLLRQQEQGQPALSPLWGFLSGPMGKHFRAGSSHPIPWWDPSPCSRCPSPPERVPLAVPSPTPKPPAPSLPLWGLCFVPSPAQPGQQSLEEARKLGSGGC